MSIIPINNANVNIAGVFSLMGEDRATLESDLSAPVSPPIGESTSAIFVSDNTSRGGIKAINSPSNLSEGQPCFDVPTRLDNSKQVGILKSKPIRDESSNWTQRFDELREQRRKIADVLFEAGRLKEANAVRYCGEDFIAYKAVCCNDTLARPMSCGHRLCPVCMVRRSAKLSDKVSKLISRMRNPKHIVLTLENVSKINKFYFKRLRGYFNKLKHRKIFRGCIGGFNSIETTYNDKEKSWHVHIHIVADVPYILKQELSDAWKDITKGSFIVDIKEIGGRGQTPLDASKEIAKYVVKPGEFLNSSVLVSEYLEAVKGTRLISTFGEYYNMVLDDEDEEGLPDCWCGKNEWCKLDGFYPVDRVFKDSFGFYRLRLYVDDG